MTAPRIAVAGAGIGGLTAGIALSQAGFDVTVFERSGRPRAGGGPVWLFANALRALRQLGLEDEIVAAGTLISRHGYRLWNGSEIGYLPFDEIAGETPLLMIGRYDIEAVLRRSLDPSIVQFGAPIAGYVPRSANGGRSVRTRLGLLTDPLSKRAAIDGVFDGLIGADGTRSTVRCQLLGPEPLEPSYHAWGGVADFPEWPLPIGESVTFIGGGRSLIAGAHPDRQDETKVLWIGGGEKVAAEDVGRVWHPRVAELLERTPEPIPFPLRDRDPSWRGRGPVTLVGDAAHPMMPAAGQGACQAIEGAASLVRFLKRYGDVERSFRAYEAERRRRVTRISRFSRALTHLLHLDGPTLASRIGIRAVMPWIVDEYRFILGDV